MKSTEVQILLWVSLREKLLTVYGGSVVKPEGKRALGIPRCRGEDNIKMDLQEIGGGGVDMIGLAHDRDD